MQKKCEVAMAFLIVLMLVFVSFSVGISYGEDDTDHDSINSIAIVEVNGRTDISILNEHHVDVIDRYGTYALIDAVEETFESLENSGLEVNTLPKRTTLNIKGMEFDFTEGKPDIPDELRIEGYESGTEGQYIVHMLGPIAPEWRSQLEEKGVDVMNYLPNYAYRVWMSPEMAEKVEDLYFVDWVGIYHPYYKLNTGLEPGTVEIGFVETDEGLKERISSKGVEIDSFVDLRYRNAGYQMVADVYEEETLHEIARSNHVSYISEYSEPTLDSEIDSQIIGGGAWIMDDEDGDPGTAYRKHGDHGAYINQIGYTGEGVTIAIADSGLGDGTTPSAGHPDFEGRVVGGHSFELPHMWADDFSHGTHVAGSAAGNTVEGTGVQYAGLDGEYYAGQGLAYESELYPIRIFSGTQNFLPDDIFEVVEVAAQDSEAYVHSNSWSKTNNGNYISVDNAFDYAARDANNDTDYDEPMVIVSSAGNSGPQYGSTGSPGNGKNVISVGATETYMLDAGDYGGVNRSNPDNVFDSSSRGWASDNRVKPDVVAPGTSILSTTSPSITNAYYDTWFKSGEYIFDINYNWKSGTSMSTPAVAGAAAVTTEWYEENYGERPSPAMVKALLINTAEPLREDQTGDAEINYIPNKHEGWGMTDISKLEYPYENPVPFYFEDQSSILTTGEVDEYEIRYDRSEEPLKLSLIWTDAPAHPGTGIGDALVNDLNLEVETPSGEIIRGNAFDRNGDSESDDGFTYPDAEVMDYFDSNGNGWDDTNNVQNVYIPSDDVETGVYTVRIRARCIREDAVGVGYDSQDYALVGYNAHPDGEVFAPDSPTDPEPEDGAADVPYWDVELSAEVSHPSGLSMDVSFYDLLDNSLIGTDYSVGSGSRASVVWPDLEPDKVYGWYAVADDGTWTTRSDNWYFITSDFDPHGESVENTELNQADETDIGSTENSRRKKLDRTFLEVTSLRADSPLIYLNQDNTLFVTVSNVGGDAGDESYKENISGSIEEIETLLDEYSDHPRARQLEKAVEDLEEALGLVSEHQREESIKSVRKAAVHLNAAGRGRQGIPTEEVVIALAETVQLKVGTVIREAKRNFGTGHPDVQEAEELFGDGVEKLEDEQYVPALNKFRKAFEVVLNAYICDAYVDVHSWMPDGYESDIGSGYVEDLEAETSETITLNWHPTERGVHQVRADMTGEYEVYSSPAETVEGPSKLTSFGMTVTSMSDEYVEWPDGKVIDADDDDLEFPSEGYDSTTIYMYKDVEGGDLVIKDGGNLIFNDNVTFVIENPDEPGQYGIDIKAGGEFAVNSPLRDTTIMSSAQDPEYTYSFKNYGTIDFTGADVMYTYGTSGSGGIRNLGESICGLQNTRVLEADTDTIYVTGSSEVSVKGEETVIGRLDGYNENIATGHGVRVEDGITPDIEDATVQYNQKSGIYIDSSSPELEPVHADDIQDYVSGGYDTQLTDDGRTSTRPVVAAGNGAVYAVYLDEDADRVYFMRSYDEGVTWTDPIVIPGSDIEDENKYIGNIDFAADGDNLAVAWEVWTEDEKFNDTIPDIYVQYSYTGGEDDNWADEPYEIGLSYNPSVEVEGDDIYVVYVYRPWPPLTIVGSIRVVWTGDNWDESEGHGFGIEEGVPKIAVVGDTVHVVIADEENIYYTKSDDGGERWDELNVVVEYENITEDVVDNYSDMHRYISLDATENRAYLVWAEYDTESECFEVYGKYTSIEDSWRWSEEKIHISYESTGDSVANAVTTDTDGNWYVVWQVKDTDGSRLRYSRLNSEGEVEVPDSYLTSDLRPAKLPSVSIDSSNNAYIVWRGDRRDVAEIYIKQRKGGVSDSTIRYNEKNGVTLRRSNNNSIAGNEIHSNSYGIRVRMSEKKDIVEYNYIHDNRIGIGLSRGYGDFPSPIKNITISNNNLARNQVGMWLDWSQENIIKYNTVSKSDWHGIWIRHSWQEGTNPSKNNILSSNHIHSNGGHGIYLYRTDGYNNNISNNILENHRFNGIFLYFSDGNTVTDNTASNNGYGIRLWNSNENRVTGNTLSDNEYGIRLDYSHGNMIYHNSFINNENHAYDEGGSSNQWDNGYPSGGNYWDDHTGPDDYKGWFQNVLGSDGIVDHPVGIPGLGATNIDTYPVVDPDRFNPTVDDIKIVDMSLIGENEIYDSELDESATITGYAAGYNDTFGYIGDINVAWDVDNFDGADAYTSPTEGESSTFHAGDSTGTAVWTAYYDEGISDSVEFTIMETEIEVDYIIIEDSQGNEIEDGALFAGGSITGYAAAYSETSGYIGHVSVTWWVTNYDGADAYTSPTEGESSTFHAGDDPGTAVWTAHYDEGISDSVEFTIYDFN